MPYIKKDQFNQLFGDTFSVNSLEIIQHKLGSDYVVFYSEILKQYAGTSSKQAKELKGALERVQRAIKLIGRAKGSGQTAITKKEAEELFNLIDIIQSDVIQVKAIEEQNKAFKKRLQNVRDEFGITTASLNLSKSTIKQGIKLQKASSPSMLEKLKQDAPELFGLGQGIGSSLMTGFLGPFSGLASSAFKGASGIYKGAMQRSVDSKKLKLSSSLSPDNLSISDYMAETNYGLRHGPNIIDRSVRNYARDTYNETGKTSAVKGKKVKEYAGTFEFWDKHAHKAKYTKDLLKAVKGISSNDSEGKIAGITGMLAKVGPALLAAAPVIAAGAAAAASIGFLNHQVKKYFGSWKGLGKGVVDIATAPKDYVESKKKDAALSSMVISKTAATVSNKTAALTETGIDPANLLSKLNSGSLDVEALSSEQQAAFYKYMSARQSAAYAGRIEAVNNKRFWQSKKSVEEEYKNSNKYNAVREFEALKSMYKNKGIDIAQLAAGSDTTELAKKLDEVVKAIKESNQPALPDITPRVAEKDPVMEYFNKGQLGLSH